MKGKLWLFASLLVLSLLFSLETTISAQPYKFRKIKDEIREMIHIHKTKKIQTPGSVTTPAGQGTPSSGAPPHAG
ncbi:hypothetical protein ISN45_Aa03g013920 [Arabidopsis thaliana x Arabidopsis arenosa]|uniref:Uncharacterized protein n=2 Tax=Arabidopsis TaxID=3701 RepID=A0A8T2B477_ARASU|nr:hypothetical protein ISN45_Aa03g013920 [Arabidopsis thaliana x Arabidopsis arenosa]KAG7581798.1 hypothetical protein ISN44_As08g014400 [Arabidopsis suecica]